MVRSYQMNDLGVIDPIASELKVLAMELARIEEECDMSDSPKRSVHVQSSIRIKRDFVRLGRELIRNDERSAISSESFSLRKI